MKTKWQTFLDTIHFAPNKSTKRRTLTLLGVFIWAISGIIIPYVINATYQQALYASVMSLFILVALLAYIKKQVPFDPAKWTYNYSKILGDIGISLLLINMISLLFPLVRIAPQPTGQLQTDTIYVVYREDCKYCKAANSNFNRAFTAYNATHAGRIRVIDMNKPSVAAKEVLNHVDRVGTVVYIDHEGQAHTDFYTLADDAGEPIAPPVEYIYQTLKQFNE